MLENVFHLYMYIYVAMYQAAILYLSRHMQYTMNAAWVVSDSYIASYLFPYFLCRSLLPFLNSKFFKTLVLFTFYGILYVVYTGIINILYYC